MITVTDNFLSEKDFKQIQEVLMGFETKWTYSPCVSSEEDTALGYFSHIFYDETRPQSDLLTRGLLNPILYEIKPEILVRIKANLYPATETMQYHEPHVDMPYSIHGAVFCINTCNGCTTIGDKQIESVANRMILFDAGKMHHSSTCTDQPVRININFNWLNPSKDYPNGI